MRYTITARWILSAKCLNGAALLASYDVPLARVCLGAANADGFTVAATSMSPQRHATTRMYRSHTSPFEYGQSADHESSMDLPPLQLCTRAHVDRRFPSTRRLRRGEATPMSTVRVCLSVTAFEWPSKLNRFPTQCSSCFHSRHTTTTRQPCVSRVPSWAGLLSYYGNVPIVPTLACTRAAMVNWICCYIAVPLLLVKYASALTRPQRVPGRIVCVIALRRPFARPKHAAPLCEAKTCSRAARHDATSSRPLHPACHQRQRARRHSACQLCCTAAWTASVLVVRS